LLVNDLNGSLAEGEAMDLAQGASFYPAARVRAASIEEMADADAVVISAGRGGRADESRLELLKDNAVIVRSIAERLGRKPGMLVVVTNPVDVMTYVATRASGLPPARVIGTGTMLDTARLRHNGVDGRAARSQASPTRCAVRRTTSSNERARPITPSGS
jgi:L-lactate dehydrogenase